MRRWIFSGIVIAGFAGLAGAQQDAGLDTLFMNDARETKRTARVLGVDEKFFKIETVLGAGAKATVSVPRADVRRIEFAPNPALDALLETATAKDLGQVALLWTRWRPFVGVPKSPAGRVANVYARLLLATESPENAQQAMAMLKEVAPNLWDEDEKFLAKQNRLRAMVATGQAAEAIEEAKELAKESEDPAVLIEAKFILAEAAHEELRQLVANNPRWEEDVNVRPERARLINDALDFYLYPYLFYGSETDAAARGLWGAVEVYEFAGDGRNAHETAKDITVLYPASRYAARAGEVVAKQSPNEKEESNDESETKTES